MNIAIIGGGITGLTAAHALGKRGHTITIFEKENTLGGLAVGLKADNWEWSIEKGYHHLFTNDRAIIRLLEELGISLVIKRPVTANFTPSGKIIQFDRPRDLLTYQDFSTVDKFRTAALLGFLKLNPFWNPLEALTAKNLFRFIGGSNPWEKLWEPLMIGKFGELSDEVAASWMWARINKRTPSLAYISGGFQTLVNALVTEVNKYGGTVYTDSSVTQVQLHEDKKFQLTIQKQSKSIHKMYDTIILTIPTPIIAKILPSLAQELSPSLQIPHLHAQTLILETKEPILNNVYWLSILNRTFPFLAVVAHTNFIDPKYYAGHHITYFGNYLPTGHKYLSMTKEQLLKEFMPFIMRLNPLLHTKYSILNTFSFIGPFAQPVHKRHYSRVAPKLKTSAPRAFIANLDSVYPWDRGTNYAVELGQRAAEAVHSGS